MRRMQYKTLAEKKILLFLKEFWRRIHNLHFNFPSSFPFYLKFRLVAVIDFITMMVLGRKIHFSFELMNEIFWKIWHPSSKRTGPRDTIYKFLPPTYTNSLSFPWLLNLIVKISCQKNTASLIIINTFAHEMMV